MCEAYVSRFQIIQAHPVDLIALSEAQNTLIQVK